MMKLLYVFLGCVLLLTLLSACSQQDEPLIPSAPVESLEASLQAGADTMLEAPRETLHQHCAAEAVREHEITATCKSVGSYERVVYCSDCGEELERRAEELSKVDHFYQQEHCIYCGVKQASVGLSYRSNGDGTCYVSGMGSCKDEDLVIPSTSPAGDTVVGIGDSAFYNRIGLFSVQMPDTMEYIGTDAFAFCPNIQSLSLSSSLKSVGAGAFADIGKECYHVYDGVNYLGSKDNPYLVLISPVNHSKASYRIHEQTKILYRGAFQGCKSLERMEIHDGVIEIGVSAFQSCESLKQVTLPKGITVIPVSLFEGCSVLETVALPATVTEIGNFAFAYCRMLSVLELHEGIVSFGESAFQYCERLTELQLPSTLRRLGMDAFKNCSGIERIEIPAGVTEIPRGLFSRCSKLKEVVLPEGITSIGYMAFSYSAVKQIILPASLTEIDSFAFEYCFYLESITFQNPVGWRYYTTVSDTVGVAIDASDAAANAQNLTKTYTCRWRRG